MLGKYDSLLSTLCPMIGHVQGTVKRSKNDVWKVVKTRNTKIWNEVKGLHIGQCDNSAWGQCVAIQIAVRELTTSIGVACAP